MGTLGPNSRLVILNAVSQPQSKPGTTGRYATALSKTTKRGLSRGARKSRINEQPVVVSIPAFGCGSNSNQLPVKADIGRREVPTAIKTKIPVTRLPEFLGMVGAGAGLKTTAWYALVKSYFNILEPVSRASAAANPPRRPFSFKLHRTVSLSDASNGRRCSFLTPLTRSYANLGNRSGFGLLSTFLRGSALRQLLLHKKNHTYRAGLATTQANTYVAVAPATLKAYTGKLWAALLRLRVERFFFKRLGRRTYVWFYNVWSVFLKKI